MNYNEIEIPKFLKLSHVAQYYYDHKRITLEKEAARKKFIQDKNIDLKLISKVLKEMGNQLKNISGNA